MDPDLGQDFRGKTRAGHCKRVRMHMEDEEFVAQFVGGVVEEALRRLDDEWVIVDGEGLGLAARRAATTLQAAQRSRAARGTLLRAQYGKCLEDYGACLQEYSDCVKQQGVLLQERDPNVTHVQMMAAHEQQGAVEAKIEDQRQRCEVLWNKVVCTSGGGGEAQAQREAVEREARQAVVGGGGAAMTLQKYIIPLTLLVLVFRVDFGCGVRTGSSSTSVATQKLVHGLQSELAQYRLLSDVSNELARLRAFGSGHESRMATVRAASHSYHVKMSELAAMIETEGHVSVYSHAKKYGFSPEGELIRRRRRQPYRPTAPVTWRSEYYEWLGVPLEWFGWST